MDSTWATCHEEGCPMSPDALLDRAREAAAHAYAPYSTFPVGCALLLQDGSVVTGCNVENASYGLSMCAERGAISRMIIETGANRPPSADSAPPRPEIVLAATAGLKAAPCYPCRACRQVLHEFDCGAIVVEDKETKGPVVIDFADLLPHAFGPADL
ncbi:cytidine deaminase [Corynebacterium heidelbergense]|nr:cytidine deaminase [Corynebacterium heidelbergense]